MHEDSVGYPAAEALLDNNVIVTWMASYGERLSELSMPTATEPVSLMRDDNHTHMPWARGKPMAWDVTVPDTYAESP